MNRFFITGAFLLGAAAIVWMGTSFIGSDRLALAVIAVIACVYCIGFFELLQFRRATASLEQGIQGLASAAPQSAGDLQRWLEQLHPSLQNAVRLRIEGERAGLPAPVMTPYLVGLLVMLGLLGTFAGMVDTLKGAVLALEGTTELQAIRAGLAAPIEGLSLAFGTSVAGVAASAMLGLISTLSRRDRMLATRRLDTASNARMPQFSLRHSSQQAFAALRDQAAALPLVASKLDAMADKLGAMGATLGDKLIEQQGLFQHSVKGIYAELAQAVDLSLRESLANSGKLAGEGIRPLVEETMAGISSQAEATHRQLTRVAQQQLDAVAERFENTAGQVADSWQRSVGEQQRCNQSLLAGIDSSLAGATAGLERAAVALGESFDHSASAWLEREQSADESRLEHWSQAFEQLQRRAMAQLHDAGQQLGQQLEQASGRYQGAFDSTSRDFASMAGALADKWLQVSGKMAEFSDKLGVGLSELRREEAQRGEAAVARLESLETSVAEQLAVLGKELEQPLSRLIAASAETPRAAAQLIGDLRKEMAGNTERDQELLEERRELMLQLDSVATTLRQNTREQGEALSQLVISAADVMQQTSERFGQQLGAESARVSEAAQLFTAGAAEMASLGESFSAAIGLFNESNTQLLSSLSRIETSLTDSAIRSDEQMAYYVAQAREIIDQSLLSQREVFEQLRQPGEGQLVVGEVE